MTAASIPATAAPRSLAPWGLSWPLLMAAAGFLLALNQSLLIDADSYWHIAAGRWIFEHLAIPTADPFSNSMPGAPWVSHEWLSEVLLGAAYQLCGWAGPVVLGAAAFAAALALLCRYLLRHLEPVLALCFMLLAACLVHDHLLARPHALVLPLIAAWGIALVRAREQGHAPAARWALLMVVWANLHGSFTLGLGLTGFFAVEALLASPKAGRRQTAMAWGRFVLLALLAAMVTPQGPAGLAFTAKLHGMDYAMRVIGEWRSPDFHDFQPLELGLMAGALAVLIRGLRLPPMRILLLLGLLHLALAHARHVEILGLVAPLALAVPVGTQWRSAAGPDQTAALDRWFLALAAPARLPAVVLTATLLAGCAVFLGSSGALKPARAITPEAAVRAAQAARPEGPVLNSYHFGGYLIFAGIPPYIDGRADMYGDPFLAAYGRALRLEASDSLPQLLESHHIGWTLLAPEVPAIALLDRLPGWRRLYADDTAVVHVRSGSR
ncbi:MAG: hypothetical protein H6R10_983 [Rhodocyclaceae bacterium]|nr:hypothetical protein [Rhodocyclaceae bacterium]